MNRKKSVKKNAVLNVIRVLSSVLFPLITFPYATRVLGADNIGKVQFGSSFIAYFSLIAALGISTYGARDGAAKRNDKKEFSQFASELFTINIISTLISYLLLFLILLFPTKLVEYRSLIFLQSLVIIFTTLGVDWIYAAQEDYLYITIKGVMVQIISLVLLLLFVKQEEDYLIYALITVIANAGMNLFNFLHARRYCRLRLVRKLNLKQHKAPLLVLFANAVAVNIYINSDIFMLGLIKTDAEVGLYSISVKIYSVTKALINAMIAVTIPRLVIYLKSNKTKYYNLSARLFNVCLLILLPSMTGIIMLKNEIIKIIAGSSFAAASSSLAILGVALIFAVLSNYFANAVLVVNKKEKVVLCATLIAAVGNILLNLLAIPLYGQNGAAITTLISEASVMIICAFYGKKYFRLNNLIKTIAQCLGGCFIISLICGIIKSFNLGIVYTVIISLILCSIFYFVFLLVTKNDTVKKITNEAMPKIKNKERGSK